MAKTGGVVEAFPSGATKVTMSAGAAITAGRLVEISGNRTVIMAGAISNKVVGVALEGSDGVGAPTADKIAVASGGIFLLTATGAVAAGDKVVAGANGTVSTVAVAAATVQGATDTRAIVGIALEAIANGQTGRVLLQTTGG
jgi:hypothetical protein